MKRFVLYTLAMAMLATSCNNDDDDDPTPTPTNTNATPSFTVVQTAQGVSIVPTSADASLNAGTIVTNLSSSSFSDTVDFGTASFYAAPNAFTSLVPAGDVFLDGTPMMNLFNSYTGSLNPNATYDFSDGATYQVTGGSGFPAFTHTAAQFPPYPAYTAPGTLSKSSNYTVSLGNAVGDLVVVFISQDGMLKHLKQYLAGQVPTTVTFTPANMQSLGMNSFNTYIQVGYYAVSQSQAGTKTIFYTNQRNVATQIDVQP